MSGISALGVHCLHRVCRNGTASAIALVLGLSATESLRAQQITPPPQQSTPPVPQSVPSGQQTPLSPAPRAGTTMPEIVVSAPKVKPKPNRVTRRRSPPSPAAAATAAPTSPTTGQTPAQAALNVTMSGL